MEETENISDFPLSHSLLEHRHDLPTDEEEKNIKKLEQEKTKERSRKMEISEYTFEPPQHTHDITHDMLHSVPIDMIVNQAIQEKREKNLKETEEVKEILLKQLRKLSSLSDEKETNIAPLFCYQKQFPELTSAISELATKLRMYL